MYDLTLIQESYLTFKSTNIKILDLKQKKETKTSPSRSQKYPIFEKSEKIAIQLQYFFNVSKPNYLESRIKVLDPCLESFRP